jgi:predicted AlkP superfamily pyrophosphatase or phosphodiesterase
MPSFITTSWFRRIVASCTLSWLALGSSALATDPPRLTVVIVIDQFRHENLQRLEDLFVDAGFRRFMDEGAWMTDATYGHLHASTSPGHSVITSGSYGNTTGMIANSWYDRELGRRRNSLEDPEHGIFGRPRDPAMRTSTHELRGSTLADELRVSTQLRGKYFAISMKDYSAMISAGKLGTPFWYEVALGRFTSSDFYMESLPDWLDAFNARKLPDSYFGKQWERLLPVSVYEQRAGADDRANEEDNRGSGITFPHTITGGLAEPGPDFYNALKHTPWSNDLELDFARQLIVEERLGDDDTPDVLVVSLSGNDYVGHDYGPFSQEVLDMTVRTDRQLADFFDFLDERIGLDRTLLVLTADHGVAPVPEETAKLGIPAARIPPKTLSAFVDERLDRELGEDDWVVHLHSTGLYLNLESIERRGLLREDVERLSAEALVAHPGVAAAYTRTAILSGQFPDTPLSRRVVHSFFPSKSGDVIPVAAPFHLLFDEYSESPYGTSHDQPYDYDIHVPLLFYGRSIKPGKYHLPVDMADVTPTLCAILGISMPSGRVGRVLGEILR